MGTNNGYFKRHKELEGKTVQTVRPLTDAEIDEMGWNLGGDDHLKLMIIFTDGTQVVPMSDPEGNHPGALDVFDPNAEDTPGGLTLVQ